MLDTAISTNFCLCGTCSWMPTESERVCCRAKKFLVKMTDNHCVTEHEDYEKIINRVTLNIKTFNYCIS